MKKQTTVKVTAMTSGTLGRQAGQPPVSRLVKHQERCAVGLFVAKPRTDLEGSWVEGEAISVDEHPQGRQGDEEPAAEGGKVDELVDLAGHQRQHHQRVLETENTASVDIFIHFST